LPFFRVALLRAEQNFAVAHDDVIEEEAIFVGAGSEAGAHRAAREATPGGAWNTLEENGQRAASNSIFKFPAFDSQETWSPRSSTTTSGTIPTSTVFSGNLLSF